MRAKFEIKQLKDHQIENLRKNDIQNSSKRKAEVENIENAEEFESSVNASKNKNENSFSKINCNKDDV